MIFGDNVHYVVGLRIEFLLDDHIKRETGYIYISTRFQRHSDVLNGTIDVLLHYPDIIGGSEALNDFGGDIRIADAVIEGDALYLLFHLGLHLLFNRGRKLVHKVLTEKTRDLLHRGCSK